MSDHAIGLADARTLDRHTLWTRIARALVALGAVAAAGIAVVAATREPPASSPLLPAGSDGIVVLDVSASIAIQAHRTVAMTLGRLAETDARYGLVLFSDTAYQALPAGTPARELGAFARLFQVKPREGSVLAEPPPSPWAETFSGGTRISPGLALALQVIERERLGRPAVLLVSDLDTEEDDVERVARVAHEYRRRGIPLRVVGLSADPADERTFRAFTTQHSDVVPAPDPQAAGTFARARGDRTVVAASATAGLLLALLVLLGYRLRWSGA